ncbi:hypothetical protein FJU08_09565 [Martelella alba]|uniref:Uncharacterized protein n=1 Tax=Martelella alba TaxID=2590451 RepID=A0A506UBX8_9HYPH|nr:hypothetical protein [Martelella alba]TPW30906.1 hypothetical protein FJU08_09565 [Martelella alba]
MQFWRWAALLGFVFAVLFSAATFWREFEDILSPDASEPIYGTALLSGPLAFAPSSRSKKAVLQRCYNVLQRRSGYAATEEQVNQLAANCVQTAAAIDDVMPSMSFARFVGSYAAMIEGNVELSNALLSEAFALGPNEGWLANQRLWFVETYRDQMSQENLALEDKDIALLASTYNGSNMLARRYVANEAFRARAVDIVETLTQTEQRRFLTRVRVLAKEQSGQ